MRFLIVISTQASPQLGSDPSICQQDKTHSMAEANTHTHASNGIETT